MIEFLAARSGGDARSALNALELACATAARTGERRSTLADAEDAMQRKALLYDKGGDQHYDYISAWIKSTRGSDPDASLYYLAAMLEGGEDPRFIVRRMVILASEDVGNADPQALQVAVAAAARGRARRAAGVPVRARPGGDLPLAGAEVQRGRARARRRARRTSASTAPRSRPAPLRSAAYPAAAQARPRASATTTRTTTRATSTTRSTCRTGLEGLRFYDPARPSRSCASASREIRRARGRRGVSRLAHRLEAGFI